MAALVEHFCHPENGSHHPRDTIFYAYLFSAVLYQFLCIKQKHSHKCKQRKKPDGDHKGIQPLQKTSPQMDTAHQRNCRIFHGRWERLPKLPSRITYKTARTPMANHIAACTACTSFPILLSAHRGGKNASRNNGIRQKRLPDFLSSPTRYLPEKSHTDIPSPDPPPQSKAFLQEVQTKRQTKSHTPVHGFQSRHTRHTLPSAIPESESGETTPLQSALCITSEKIYAPYPAIPVK